MLDVTLHDVWSDKLSNVINFDSNDIIYNSTFGGKEGMMQNSYFNETAMQKIVAALE